MKTALRILSIPLITFAVLVAFMFGQAVISIEGYNPVQPDIDTHFPEKYSEENFLLIKQGMTGTEVINLIGPPLHSDPPGLVKQHWSYSSDGKCTWADFAWLGRDIYFENGVVTQVTMGVRYD